MQGLSLVTIYIKVMMLCWNDFLFNEQFAFESEINYKYLLNECDELF